MNWKILFRTVSVVMILFFNVSQGQNYKVFYDMVYKTDSSDSETQKKAMVLLIKDNQSKFFSQEQLINDSVIIEKQKTNGKALKKYDYNFMTIKDNQEKKLHKFNAILRDLYKITESMPVFNWIITGETKTINTFTCQKATLNYANRSWEAWFTTDIALHEGPYVFNGLPGLIISLKDSKNNYEFSFSGLKKNEVLNVDYLSTKPFEVTAKQFNKALLDHYNDPYREMKAGNIKVRWQDEDGKEFKPDYKELTKTEQKNIKKHNNPIELTEAIHYPTK
ncbi:hypothetical protein CHRY9390_01528 [Chryseobacterium aquaeductus]|uniref:GLPGLI family protein n=1 Tax=Chryseobacterium aquaeductus TaxID=2675056 RepID=A0A9N8MG74_9FLAO|nr:GLPGLI family protein [Chryseobacterium aquaeductus]CAA7330855.1 hypothetical protein CHRY9390_01528 [Chryseobacterium potabilaquae]CAD7806559.1 hypothetical protein CHRY9390_01528 [Chryseobacterium aquaeductus]